MVYDNQDDHTSDTLFVADQDTQPDDLLDDTLSEDEIEPGIIDFSSVQSSKSFTQLTFYTPPNTVIAVDSGVIDLGETASGSTVFAVRGASICYPANNAQPFVCLYNTGALIIDNSNKLPVFHYMGTRFGREDLFVNILATPPYYSPKQAMAETPNQIQDRIRNFVERMIQEEAISILASYGGGILLIDGALSGGTFDTPERYMQDLLQECRNLNINIAAISKKTRITVGGVPISSVFADQPDFIGYAPLSKIIENERNQFIGSGQTVRSTQTISVADDIFAARFSYAPFGLTFRVDVHPRLGMLSSEVLDQVYNDCQIYGGYPRPLIDVHQYSSFLYQDVQNLLADITVKTGMRPQEQPSMGVLFQPFGGKYK